MSTGAILPEHIYGGDTLFKDKAYGSGRVNKGDLKNNYYSTGSPL